MRCPKCRNFDTKVIDSRIIEEGKSIRRRRECELCDHRFTTFERMEFINFIVRKSNGKDEFYNRMKLENSIIKACNKRQIPIEKIENMILTLESTWAANKKGVTSKRIGKDVLAELKGLDEVAYIRYASVYHNFDSSKDFWDFVSSEEQQ